MSPPSQTSLTQAQATVDKKRLTNSSLDLDRDGDVDGADNAINDLDHNGRIDSNDREIYDLDNDQDIDATDHEIKNDQEQTPSESVGSSLGLTRNSEGKWQKSDSQSQQVSGPRQK